MLALSTYSALLCPTSNSLDLFIAVSTPHHRYCSGLVGLVGLEWGGKDVAGSPYSFPAPVDYLRAVPD